MKWFVFLWIAFAAGYYVGFYGAEMNLKESRNQWLSEKKELLKRLDAKYPYRDKMLPGEPE